MKTINSKPFKYNKETKRWDKQSEESETVILSVAAKLALESNSEKSIARAACVASFSNIFLNGLQDAFYKFSLRLLGQNDLNFLTV